MLTACGFDALSRFSVSHCLQVEVSYVVVVVVVIINRDHRSIRSLSTLPFVAEQLHEALSLRFSRQTGRPRRVRQRPRSSSHHATDGVRNEDLDPGRLFRYMPVHHLKEASSRKTLKVISNHNSDKITKRATIYPHVCVYA